VSDLETARSGSGGVDAGDDVSALLIGASPRSGPGRSVGAPDRPDVEEEPWHPTVG
jgi:hypothetical protein